MSPDGREAVQEQVRCLARGWGARRLAVECGLLGRLPDGEICAAACIDSEVLAAFEAEFFNVRPHLNERTWVYLHAIRDPDPLVATVRRLSYGGGPHFVRALIPVLPRLLAPSGSGDCQEDREIVEGDGLVRQIRLIAAMEAEPVNDADLAGWLRLQRMPTRRRRARKPKDKVALVLAHAFSKIPGLTLRCPDPSADERDAEIA